MQHTTGHPLAGRALAPGQPALAWELSQAAARLAVRRVPARFAPRESFRQAIQVEGARAGVRIARGTDLTASLLASPADVYIAPDGCQRAAVFSCSVAPAMTVGTWVFSVRIVDPESFNRVFQDTPLEVILVNAKSSETPAQAQALWQRREALAPMLTQTVAGRVLIDMHIGNRTGVNEAVPGLLRLIPGVTVLEHPYRAPSYMCFGLASIPGALADAKAISVAVHGSDVTLSGHVRNWAERATATQSAWGTPGVRNVVDMLTLAA